MEPGLKILIVDDNPAVLDMVSWALELDGYEPFEAQDGSEGLRCVKDHCPDLILLDFTMPGMDGIEFMRRLRAVGDSTPIIIISTHVEEQAWCIENGVEYFVAKPFHVRNLLDIVKVVLRKAKEKPQPKLELTSVLRFADLKLDTQARLAWRNTRELELTAKEFDLLAFFLWHPRRVLSRGLILDHVWGFDFEGESNIVDVYVGYLRTELEKESEPRLIQTVRSVGYVLREPEKRK